MIENIGKVVSVKTQSSDAPAAEIYAHPSERTALLVLAGPQSAKPQAIVITLGIE